MRALIGRLRSRPHLLAVLAMLLLTLITAATVYLSATARPEPLFAFERPAAQGLPADSAIAGWATVDRDSVYIGNTLKYRIRVLYRQDAVAPRFDATGMSVDHGHFTSLGASSSERAVGPGVREYILEHTLQALEVVPQASYRFDPAVVHYKPAAAGEMKTLQIEAPAVHVSGYYPSNASGTPLQALKGRILDPRPLRRSVVLASGLLLLGLAVVLLWRSARRRQQLELSPAERLWRELHEHEADGANARASLQRREKIFTRLLRACTGTGPDAFWAGEDPADEVWRERSRRARRLLQRGYGVLAPSGADVARATALLDEALAGVVAEERLRREAEPSPLRRLLRQPAIVALSLGCLLLAALMLLLAARPAAWLSPAVARYGDAVELLRDEATMMRGALALSELGEQLEDVRIRAAALYDAGTAMALLNPLRESRYPDKAAIVREFQDRPSLDQVVASQDLLANAERRLKQAALDQPQGEAIGRNLELVMKRRRVVADALVELLKLRQERYSLDEGSKKLLEALETKSGEDTPAMQAEADSPYHMGEQF